MNLLLLIREEERHLVSTGRLTFRGEINPFIGAYVKVGFLLQRFVSFGLKHAKPPAFLDAEI